jgi:hypothetical protein
LNYSGGRKLSFIYALKPRKRNIALSTAAIPPLSARPDRQAGKVSVMWPGKP